MPTYQPSNPQRYETISRGFHESLRSEGCVLAGHAQHPVIIHFPIALFIASVVFELLAVWRKQPLFATVAYYNLLGAALTLPLAIATGLERGNGSSKAQP